MDELTKAERWMTYPTFTPTESGIIVPSILLPRHYQSLVTKFYEQNRDKDITNYVKTLDKIRKKEMSNYEIRLTWQVKDGLININLSPNIGFDLETEMGWPRFVGHNLSTDTGFIAGAIAMQYISELLKSE